MSDPARKRRPPPTATQRALGLLVRREHSRKELGRKLAARGVEPDEAAAAIDKLSEAGWQDDVRFAELLVRSRAASGHGPVRIRAELRTHGLDSEAIAAALDGFDGDWNAIARDLVRRRFDAKALATLAGQRKAADLLLRRGFAMEQVRSALGGADFDD
jgi:regulatory protein